MRINATQAVGRERWGTPDAGQRKTGRGINATVEGRALSAGGPNMLGALNVTPDDELRAAADRASSRGQGTIYLIEADRQSDFRNWTRSAFCCVLRFSVRARL